MTQYPSIPATNNNPFWTSAAPPATQPPLPTTQPPRASHPLHITSVKDDPSGAPAVTQGQPQGGGGGGDGGGDGDGGGNGGDGNDNGHQSDVGSRTSRHSHRRRRHRRGGGKPPSDDGSSSSSDSSSSSSSSEDSHFDSDDSSADERRDQRRRTKRLDRERKRKQKERKRREKKVAEQSKKRELKEADKSDGRAPLAPFEKESVRGWIRAVSQLRESYKEMPVQKAVLKSIGALYHKLMQDCKPVPTDVKSIVAEIRRRYDFHDDAEVESELGRMTPSTKESTTDFVLRATAVARQCCNDDRDEARLVRTIIDLTHRDQAYELRRTTPKIETFRRLASTAREMDAARRSGTQVKSVYAGVVAAAEPSSGATAGPTKSKPKRRIRKKKGAAGQTPPHDLPKIVSTEQGIEVHGFGAPTAATNATAQQFVAPVNTTPSIQPSARPAGGQPPNTAGAPTRPCFWCSSRDHWDRFCPSKPPFNPNAVCERCGQVGHILEHCRTIECNLCRKMGHPAHRCPIRPTTAGGAQAPQVSGAVVRATNTAATPAHTVSYADPVATTYSTATPNDSAASRDFHPGHGQVHPWPSGGSS
jgi:hypothetical protein